MLMKKLKVTFSSFRILLYWFLIHHLQHHHFGVNGRPDNIIAAVAEYGNLDYHHIHSGANVPSSSGSIDHYYNNHNSHHQYDTGVPKDHSSNTPDDDNDHGYQQHDGPNNGPSRKSKSSSSGNCKLPTTWKGKWFQSGFPSPLTIDDKSIGHKGLCLDSSGTDKFLFFEASTNCHRCVVIIEHHTNVLQYKESQFCEDKDTLENLCSQIPGDASLYSLFRIDAKPIECPFKGAPFTFTYNRGHGECRDPVSHVDTCTESSRLLLRYQACPNVQKTESTSEELECLATWRDGSNHYLIGKLYSRMALGTHEISNEERYRCFVYEAVKNHSSEIIGHSPIIGYKVAQSGDASCTGVTSTDTGARALTFTRALYTPTTKCKFPLWVGAHHWHSLDSKISVKLHSKGSLLNIQEESKKNHSFYSNYGSYNTGNLNSPLRYHSSLFNAGSRIVCQSRNDMSERHVIIKAIHSEGCKTETICLNIYKRHNNVIEMKILKQSSYEDGDCTKRIYSDEITESSPYITLINSSPPLLRCPNLGKYMASGIKQDGRIMRDACNHGSTNINNHGSFNTLVVGCDDQGTMEFHSKCASEEPITSYSCHGNWEEDGTRYLIASPRSRSSASARRYCFMYTQTDGELRISSSRESCRRNISPGIGGSWAFNLTANGHCAERLTGDDASLGSKSFNINYKSTLMYSVIYFLCFSYIIQISLISLLDFSSIFPTR